MPSAEEYLSLFADRRCLAVRPRLWTCSGVAEKPPATRVAKEFYRDTRSPEAPTDDHFRCSKRAMANELVLVMDKLGFPNLTLVGHDRDGRVSYRLALDHSKKVERLAVFDAIPILEA